MKKLGFVLLGLVVLLVIGALIAPHFINANQYKSKITSEFKAKTGYDINIKGEIKISLIPLPKAYVQGVTISNGAKVLAEVDEITAYPKLLPLLSKKVEISSISLSKPKVTLEKNAGGYSWQKVDFGRQTFEVRGQGTGDRQQSEVSIGEVKIVDGEVDFNDLVGKKNYSAKAINLTASVTSLQGPVRFDARLKINGAAVSAKGSVENFGDPKIAFDGDFAGSKISFNGVLSNGKFSAKSSDIGPLADLLGISAAKQYDKLQVDIASDVGYTKNNLSLQNLKVTLGDTVGGGNLSLSMDGEIEVAAALKFSKINLDQLLPEKAAEASAPKTDAEVLAEDTAPDTKPVIADIDASADEIIYGGMSYKNLVVKAATENQEVTLQPFKIDLPGNGKAEIYGVLSKDTKGRVFDGHINAAGGNLRDILTSLKVNVAGVNERALKNFSLDSDVIITLRERTRADFSKILLKFDETVFNGSAALDMTTKPMGVGLSGTIDKVNLNNYLKAAAPKPQGPKGEANLSEVKPYDFSGLTNFPLRAALNISLGNLVYSDDSYGNVRVRLDAAPGSLNFSELTASSRKIQVAAKAQITAQTGRKPKIDVEANIGKIDTADFIKTKAESGSSSISTTPKQGKERWSTAPIDLSFLKKLDVEVSTNIASLINGKFTFDNVAFSGYIEDGQLNVQNFSGGVFGGKISAKAVVTGSAVPGISLSFAGSDIDIYKLATALSNNQRLQGKISLSSTFATSGVNQLAMIQNLKGSVSLVANQVIVKGFDIDGFVKQITNISNPEAVLSIARTISGDNAVTYLNNLTGSIGCENGVCRTQSGGIKISTASSSQGNLDGFADLVNWKMDMNALFNLLIPGDSGKELPSLGLHIYGAIDQPKLDVNYDEIKRYLVQRGGKMLLRSGLVPDKYKSLLGETAPNDNGAIPTDNGKKPKIGKLLQNIMGGAKQ